MTPQPIRVCFLIDELSKAGTEMHLLSLIEHLDRTRVQPYLCLLRGRAKRSRELEPRQCPILRLGMGPIGHPSSLMKLVQLGFFLRRNQIDILQTYFPDSTLVGFLIGWLVRVPVLVRTRNNLGYSQSAAQRRLNQLYDRLARATVANCRACRDSLVAEGYDAVKPVAVIENGVDLHRYVGPFQSNESVSVGVVANLRPVKNLGMFLQAAALLVDRYPNLRFSIAGEGPSRGLLERQIRQLGLEERMTLLGRIANIPQYLARLDIAVLCSVSEGMSNAVLEYMAAGRAVVATAVGANAELINNGTTGLLVPSNDTAALASAMQTLIDDPELRLRLGTAARSFVQQNYSRQRAVARYQALYHQLVRG